MMFLMGKFIRLPHITKHNGCEMLSVLEDYFKIHGTMFSSKLILPTSIDTVISLKALMHEERKHVNKMGLSEKLWERLRREEIEKYFKKLWRSFHEKDESEENAQR